MASTALEEPDEVWDWVERAKRGDRDAFARIYRRYLDTVFRFVYFRVGNRQLAEDMTGEAFLRALKRIGTVTWQGRDLGAWLVTIARNIIYDYFKSGRYRLELPIGDVLDADSEAKIPEARVEETALLGIESAALREALVRLLPTQRRCLTLRFLHDLSVAETAQVMGIAPGAVKALQYRATNTLHRMLAAQGEAWPVINQRRSPETTTPRNKPRIPRPSQPRDATRKGITA